MRCACTLFKSTEVAMNVDQEHFRVLHARNESISQHETLSSTRQKAHTIVEFALVKRRQAGKKFLAGRIVATLAAALLVTWSSAFADTRVIDLGSYNPDKVEQAETESLPLLTQAELERVLSIGVWNVFESTLKPPTEVPVSYEVPPAIDAEVTSSARKIEEPGERTLASHSEPAEPLPGMVARVQYECLEGLCDQGTVDAQPCQRVRSVDFAEYPILGTHRVLSAVHHCTKGVGNKWIYWKDEYCPRQPGPVCCSLQQFWVNWRHASVALQGCLPDGYTMSCFIETVPQATFHATPLAVNGPVDTGGSMDEAKTIDGEETKSLREVSINIAPSEGALPDDRAKEKFDDIPMQVHLPGTHRNWAGTSYYWNASLLSHQPLYFEDVNLEYHGFSYGVFQPVVSGAKFLARVPALPYLMTLDPPSEMHYSLGQTRPGNHACYTCERPAFQFDAASVEAAVIVGLVFLIP